MAKKKESLRDMTTDELQTKEREFSDQMFRLKFQLASGQTDVLQKIRELKKEIARVKTILRENELQAGKVYDVHRDILNASDARPTSDARRDPVW